MTMTNDLAQHSLGVRSTLGRRQADQGRCSPALTFLRTPTSSQKHQHELFPANQVTAIIGPSGCGKSTLLRCFNRIHDLYPDTRYEGKIVLQPSGINLIGPETDPLEMRMRMSMVFKSRMHFQNRSFENVAFRTAVERSQRQGTRGAGREIASALPRCGTK